MRSKIYTVLASAALMAAAALAPNSAMADTTLNVPFSFIVAGKACPAGHYTVREYPIGSFMTLTNQDSSRVFTWLVRPSEPGFKNGEVVLQFDVMGATHLLHSVQVGPMTTSVLDKDVDINEYRSAELATHHGQ